MMLSRRSAMLSALAACVTAPHRSWAQPASAAAGEEAATGYDPPRPAAQHRSERKAGLGARHSPAGWHTGPYHRSGKAVSGSRRQRARCADSHPLAWLDASLAAGWRSWRLRAADPARRQRRIRLPAALRRHVLDAFAPGPTRTGAPRGTAHHSRRARPAGCSRKWWSRWPISASPRLSKSTRDCRNEAECGCDAGHARHGLLSQD